MVEKMRDLEWLCYDIGELKRWYRGWREWTSHVISRVKQLEAEGYLRYKEM